MNLTELGAALGPFFDVAGSPTHQQLRDAFTRHGLGYLDPAPNGRTSDGSHLGKMKRVRQVFASPAAHNATAGLPLAQELVALCRAHGGFNPGSESYAGHGRVTQLVQAFAPLGLTLELDGSTRPTVIDNLSGTELTATLRSYVDRINSNPDDTPLQIGTGKELDEAAARHVLIELLGDYPVSGNFPVTLTSAFTAIGMATPTELPRLDTDPHRAVHQCLFLLATAVNRLRNDARHWPRTTRTTTQDHRVEPSGSPPRRPRHRTRRRSTARQTRRPLKVLPEPSELQYDLLHYFWRSREETTPRHWEIDLAVQDDQKHQLVGLCVVHGDQVLTTATAANSMADLR